MLNKAVQFSVRHAGVVLVLALLVLVYGVFAIRDAKYDVFPEFAAPQVGIQSEARGLSPEQVEVLVTQPLENALGGVAGITSLRSSSLPGLSVITVTFADDVNIYLARQSVAERLVEATPELPAGADTPNITPLTSSTGDLMTIGLSSDKMSLMELRTLSDWTVRQRLLAVPGVAKVSTFGGEVRQFQIQIDPDKLVRFDLTVDDVIAAAQKSSGVIGAGFIENDKTRVLLSADGQSLTADAIAHVPVIREDVDGVALDVRLGDVGKVVEAQQPAISAGTVMGKTGVVLNIWSQFQANTLVTTAGLEKALSELRPALDAQGVTLYPDLFRAANFIETSTANVRRSLIIGAFLVSIVLFLFLLDWRTAAVSCTAIPLSLIAAVIVLQRFGMSLNTITLGGLALAIGEVVDDAVIDVENILRRLKENTALAKPRPVWQVVLSASLEVRASVVYATFAVVIAFLPILAISGLAGRLFAPLGYAYISAILASLAIALTVTPALSIWFLGEKSALKAQPQHIHILKNFYSHLLAVVERRTVIMWIGLVIILVTGGLMTIGLKARFLPNLKEGHFIIHITAEPGTSIPASVAIGNELTAELLKLPYVRTVAQRVGRAEADDTFGPHESEFEVDLKPLKPEEFHPTLKAIRKILKAHKELDSEMDSFLTERINETLSGYTSDVALKIYGSDLAALEAKGKEVETLLNSIPEASDVRLQAPGGLPQLNIKLRPHELANWGFAPATVLEALHTAFQGQRATQVYDGNRVFDVSVVLNPNARHSAVDVAKLPLRTASGIYVTLGQIADIESTNGRSEIMHEGGRRVQVVTCNVKSNDVGGFMSDLKKRITQEIKLPAGTYIEYAGSNQEQEKSQREILIDSLMAAVAVMVLLSLAFASWRNLVLVLIDLPLALIGGLAAVRLTGGVMTIGSLVGFVTLFGITLRNSIMLISHYEHMVKTEGFAWNQDTSVRGASERLLPILMTAIVTALGLAPLALSAHTPGHEIEGPMAQVILGGLFTSTVLNLLILPVLALRYGRFEKDAI